MSTHRQIFPGLRTKFFQGYVPRNIVAGKPTPLTGAGGAAPAHELLRRISLS